MSLFEGDRSRWLNGTVLRGDEVSIYNLLNNCQCACRSHACTYPTYHICTSATLADHVTGAIARLSIVAAAIFHVEPVTGASTVAKGFGTIDRDVFVLAVEG
ncbi:unnamed protein product [Fusarium graminearum]|nr:unnamed protein product [Fusarium graminearum]CAG1959269.1 unnamed protein product [Fusarium graminearum]VTO94346.1 unnamed protein product [Fusarium graminearum]